MRPYVVLSGARAAYVGPGLDLEPHHNAAATLAVALDHPFEYSRMGNDPAPPRHADRVLIPPDTRHHLRADGRVAFLYLDATSDEYEALQGGDWGGTPAARTAAQRAFTHPTGPPSHQILGMLEAMGITARKGLDPRVREVARSLSANPQLFTSVSIAANQARLSTHRFQHLFRAEMGVPFRRYRRWSRMAVAARVIADGGSLTDAALEAGFSSSAHFSASFRGLFGLSPSRLLSAGVELRIDRNDG
ncbi:MAG: helix-turn-helix domain-containing protein [Nannocystaceae bacterium]|nr:helix-turn-helix domain-containing protein [Nannocystaceae bacterium]